jgi:ribosomal protein S8
MSKNTKEKYGALIMDIASGESFRIDEMRMKHKVSTRVFTIMRDLGYIKSVPYSMHVWHADAPTQITINLIIKECRKSSRIEKVMAKQSTPQLTIKPIKRVERTQPVPQPDVDLLNYDRSNSKMIIILTVGVILGFLIATIIWK